MNERALKKIGAMVFLLAVAVGVVGGCWYLCNCGAWVPALCVVMLAACAFPTVVKVWNYWWKG